MKRVRSPLAQAGCQNSPPPPSLEKRSRQDGGPPASGASREQQRQQHARGPFQSLLAEHGVIWPSPEAMVASSTGDKSSLGLPCRSNPSKLRVGVERALVHDGSKRREFVEVGAPLFFKRPLFSCANFNEFVQDFNCVVADVLIIIDRANNRLTMNKRQFYRARFQAYRRRPKLRDCGAPTSHTRT